MQQTLFTIPHEVFGIPIFGIGWALMGWGIASVVILVWLIRRQGWNADTGSYAVFLLVVAAVIAFGLPVVENAQGGFAARPGIPPPGLQVRGYGAMLLLAVVSGVGLAAWRAKRMGVDPDVIYSLAFWMFVFGILGARAFYVIEYWDDFRRPSLPETLLAMLNVSQGGLVVYGSAIGAVVAGAIWLARQKLPVLAMADLVAPSMVLGLAIGRLGCFLNGCCFGGLCDVPWAVQFPRFSDSTATSESPPYFRQHQLGQLHGFQIDAGETGGPVVGWLDPEGPAAKGGLKEEDPIGSIQLSPEGALHAAAAIPEFAGKAILVQTAAGDEQRLVVPPWDVAGHRLGVSRLGLEAFGPGDGPAAVKEITVGGAADAAGIQAGDQIVEVRLPPTPTADVARQVMQRAGPRVTIETDRGAFSWNQERLPPRSLPIHPTQVYSSITAFLIFFFLWVYYPFRTHDGEVFALLFTIYPLARYLEEIIRTDEPPQFGTELSISQLISIGVLVCAIALWAYVLRRPGGSALPHFGK